MALTRRTENTSKKSDVVIDNLDEREYEARLVMVADLGLQEQEYAGEKKNPAQQVSLGLEILGETITVDGEERPRILWTKPFNIFATLTEKGNELKYYSVFDPSAEAGELPDWDAQLGKPCSVFIKHTTSGDNVYDNISKVVAIPSKYQDNVPPATAEMGVGDADDADNMVTKSLFGLAKYVFDKRIGGNAADSSTEEESTSDDFDDSDVPY
jgi:hypothetical protein